MSAEEAKKGPGRPKKDAPLASEKPATATGPASAGPIKPLEAQRNLHATFKLAARVLRSDASFAENTFEDAANGLIDTARQFPQAEPAIRAIVRALGPAVTAADLVEKLSRVFARSGVKKDLEAKGASWRSAFKRKPAQEAEYPGADPTPDV